MTVHKSRLTLEQAQSPIIGPEFDLSDYKNIALLPAINQIAIAERVRYCALVAGLRENRILGRASQSDIRKELLLLADEAIGTWFDLRNQAPPETANYDIEGEAWSRAYAVFAVGMDEPDALTVEIFERLA